MNSRLVPSGQFVRPTALGAALYAAASLPGHNHPVGIAVKRRICDDDRDMCRAGYSVLELSRSPKKAQKK
jgi:hypothetical protein